MNGKRPRVAFFACAYHEVDGVARTSRQFEAFAQRRDLPLLMVHAGPENAVARAGSVTELQLRRSPHRVFTGPGTRLRSGISEAAAESAASGAQLPAGPGADHRPERRGHSRRSGGSQLGDTTGGFLANQPRSVRAQPRGSGDVLSPGGDDVGFARAVERCHFALARVSTRSRSFCSHPIKRLFRSSRKPRASPAC